MARVSIENGPLERASLSDAFVLAHNDIAACLEVVAIELRPHFLPRAIGPHDPLKADVFLSGLEGGARTMRAVAVMLELGWPAQAIVLARTLYEMSVRLLWAAREADGPQRLWRSQVFDRREGRLKLAKATDLDARLRAETEAAIKEYNETLKVLEDAGVTKGLPKLPDVITRINELDVEREGVTPGTAMSAARDYGLNYTTASEVAHGHPIHFGSAIAHEHADFAHAISWRSSINLVRAVHYAAGLPFPEGPLTTLTEIGTRRLKARK